MGTESKYNSCTENTTTGVVPKVLKANNLSVTLKSEINKDSICEGKAKLLNATDKNQLSVPFISIYVDENNVVEGAKAILREIRPHWDLNTVQFKKFTDGITNKLVGCFNTQGEVDTNKLTNGNGSITKDRRKDHINDDTVRVESAATTHSNPLNDVETENETEKNVVLVRVYGNKTDLLIDRKAETRNIVLLHSYGFAPTLYATFKNGLVYDYIPGVTLNKENFLLPEVWRLVACRVAEMHRDVNADGFDASNGKPQAPMLWTKTQAFLDLVPEQFSDADKHKRLEGTFLPISRLRDEFNTLYQHLETLGSPIVFAHNDLLLGNVVYTESLQTVNFIDFEYADYNYQAFDIGNHFAEFAGVDEVDYTRYPNAEFQKQWLLVYLQTFLRRADISNAEVERLYVQVNQFALAAHFFWAIWSLIQAEHSTLDFDYVSYAYVRYNEYLARKEEFLALKPADVSNDS